MPAETDMPVKHTATQRLFIVNKVAAYYTANEIVGAFKVEFPDTDCDERDVHACDPRYSLLGPDEVTAFRKAREAMAAEMARLWPTASETMRIMLLGMSRDHEVQRNRNAFDLANKTAETFAKIEAGFFVPKGAAATKEADKPEPVTEIVTTIVDPKQPVAA
jgi:hypothetical protein